MVHQVIALVSDQTNFSELPIFKELAIAILFYFQFDQTVK